MDDILLENPQDQDEEASASSDEDDNHMEDEGRHKNLLNSLGVKEKSERIGSGKDQRSEALTDVSVFSLGAAKKSKIKPHQLIEGLKESVNVNVLKKKLLKVEKSQKHLRPSLPRAQAEKLERQVAYETTSEKVSRWEDIVQRNRRAEHLSFPLNQETLNLNTVDEYVKNFKPKTPLEEQIYGLLTGNKYVEREGKDLSLAEEEALKAMSIDEARMRRADLQKHRALLSYHEAKAKRIKKIKSRRHLRIIRKQKEKLATSHAKDDNNNDDDEDLDDKIKLADKMRAEERAGLRHRQGSKWAKRRMAMGRYNEMTKIQIDEQKKLHGQLTHKDVQVVNEEESERGKKGYMAATIPTTEFLGLPKNNPWLRVANDDESSKEKAEHVLECNQDIPNPRKKSTGEKKMLLGLETIAVDQEEEDGEEVLNEMEEELHQIKERKKLRQGFSNKEKTVKKKDENELENSDEDEERVNESSIAKFKAAFASISHDIQFTENSVQSRDENDVTEPEILDPIENGLEVGTNRRKTLDDLNKVLQMEDDISTLSELHRISKETPKQEVKASTLLTYIDPKKVFTLPSKTVSSVLTKIVEDEDDQTVEEDDNRMTIQEAFADDDVLEDFLREKKKGIEDSAPKPEDLTLPGWGEWGGLGVQPSRRKKRKFFIEPKPGPARKDQHLGAVIINEKRDVYIARHQVKQIPFPFMSEKQFERSIRQPIGSTWNTPSIVKKLTQPRVTTAVGAIIQPMDEEEAFDKTKSSRKRTISQDGDDKNEFKGHFKRMRGNKKHKK